MPGAGSTSTKVSKQKKEKTLHCSLLTNPDSPLYMTNRFNALDNHILQVPNIYTREVKRDLWRQTSFADFTHARHRIVWDKDKRQNVTKHVDASTSEHSLFSLSASKGRSRWTSTPDSRSTSTPGSVLSLSATEMCDSFRLSMETKGVSGWEGQEDTENVLRTMEAGQGGRGGAGAGAGAGAAMFHVEGGARRSEFADKFGNDVVDVHDDEDQDSLEMEV